ncbi:Biofilm associated protein A, partial [Budviciaceae bacterium BWR-B9]
MNKTVNLLVSTNGEASQIIPLNYSKLIKIKIQAGNKYLLKNGNDNYAPENVTIYRNDNDLYIILEGDDQPSLVFEDYYISGEHAPLLGMAEDGQIYSYVVTDGSSIDGSYLINQDVSSPIALGGGPMGDGAYLFGNAESNDDLGLLALWPWFLGGAAVGGLIGNAIYESNKDNDGLTQSPTPASEPTLGGATDAIGDITGPIKPMFEAIDDVGTITGIIANGATTDDNCPEFTGKGEIGNTITVYIDGKVVGSTTIGSDGTWSFTPKDALADGHYQVTVTETDKVGNTSATSPTFDFDVDTTAPDKPPRLEAYDDVGEKTGLIKHNGITDDSQPTFTGEGEPGNTITIIDNDKELGTTIVDDNGQWTFTPDEPLDEGDHSVVAKETDEAGNESKPSDAIDFEVDTTPPEKPEQGDVIDDEGSITGPIQNGDVTDDSQPTFTGEGAPGNTITIIDNDKELGTTIVDDNGQWTFTPDKSLSDGEHNIVITETDEAGNTSAPSDEFEFVVDTSTDSSKLAITGVDDQVGSVTGNVNKGETTDDTRPTISGTGTAGDTI